MASEQQTTMEELRQMLTSVLKTQSDLSQKMEDIASDVKMMNTRLVQMEKVVVMTAEGGRAGNAGSSAVDEIRRLSQLVALHDAHGDRSRNLLLFGIPQLRGDPLEDAVKRFLQDILGVNRSRIDSIPMLTVLMPKMSSADVHPPILVKFRTFEDREYIKKKFSSNKKELADMNVRFSIL